MVRLDGSVVIVAPRILSGLFNVSSAGHDFIVTCCHKFAYLPMWSELRGNRFICSKTLIFSQTNIKGGNYFITLYGTGN